MFIKIGTVESQLVGQPSSALHHRLRGDLSFKNQSHIIARAVARKRLGYIPKNLKWDGITYLINDKYVFPTGLIHLVRQALTDHDIRFTEIEEFQLNPHKTIPLQKELNPWEHQREAIDEIKENRTGIIKIGTGGGKTKLSIVAASEIGELPFLFVVNRISLLDQTHAEYSQYFNQEIGYIGNGQVKPAAINIATIGTLCSVLNIKYSLEDDEETTYTPEQIEGVKKLLKECRFVIIDECHHAAADTYKLLLKNLPNAVYRIGLSATPYRTDGTEILLFAAFGKVIYEKSASDLIRKGVLRKPKIRIVRFKDPKTKLYPRKGKGSYAKIYKECVVDNELFNRMLAMIALANARQDRLTLISITRIPHGENILREVLSLDPNAAVVLIHGKNKDKLGLEKIKQEFVARKVMILISTLLDEGVDIPAMETSLDAGGGKSPIKTLQLTGRNIRDEEGKKDPIIYIFVQDFTHLYKHSIARVEILQTEPEFDLEVLDWEDMIK